LGIRIFFLEKKHNPPLKLNGRSLRISRLHIFYTMNEVCHWYCGYTIKTELPQYRTLKNTRIISPI
jgi:hypothetical protein